MGDFGCVGDGGVSGGDEGFPEGPGAGTSPGGGIEGEEVVEGLAALVFEESPGDSEVAGGIAGGELAEVDDCGEAAVLDEEVAGADIAVDPDGEIGPGGNEGGFPEVGGGGGVDFVFKGGDCVAGFGVVDG